MTDIISTNSLFHFTKKVNNIFSILENDFYPQYCIEEIIDCIYHVDGGTLDSRLGVPMVCFCDIPLSQINKHTTYYGNYAIGLTKDWAKRNKINPVLYMYPNSGFTDYFRRSNI